MAFLEQRPDIVQLPKPSISDSIAVSSLRDGCSSFDSHAPLSKECSIKSTCVNSHKSEASSIKSVRERIFLDINFKPCDDSASTRLSVLSGRTSEYVGCDQFKNNTDSGFPSWNPSKNSDVDLGLSDSQSESLPSSRKRPRLAYLSSSILPDSQGYMIGRFMASALLDETPSQSNFNESYDDIPFDVSML